jgi:hypothetical protein
LEPHEADRRGASPTPQRGPMSDKVEEQLASIKRMPQLVRSFFKARQPGRAAQLGCAAHCAGIARVVPMPAEKRCSRPSSALLPDAPRDRVNEAIGMRVMSLDRMAIEEAGPNPERLAAAIERRGAGRRHRGGARHRRDQRG